eukprot:9496013-Alexandrium_andersonii.AAC.1
MPEASRLRVDWMHADRMADTTRIAQICCRCRFKTWRWRGLGEASLKACGLNLCVSSCVGRSVVWNH